MMMIAVITIDSSFKLVPLIEGLRAQILYFRFESRCLWLSLSFCLSLTLLLCLAFALTFAWWRIVVILAVTCLLPLVSVSFPSETM